jgi:hypothetical protein
MKSIQLLFAGAALFASACASSPEVKNNAAPATSQDAPKDNAEEMAIKRADLERQVALAGMRLEKTKMDADHQSIATNDSLKRAEEELQLSRDALAQFERVDSKTRIEQARLNMKRMEDGLAEAEEELQQLEFMYQDQDLADKTKEIVLRRGKRRVERSKAQMAIEKQNLETLETKTLPLESKRLKMDLESKELALEAVRRAKVSQEADRKMAQLAAEGELVKMKNEMSALDKADKSKKPASGAAPK